MTGPFELAMRIRSRWLLPRVLPHMPCAGSVLDVGSGTGHVARALRSTGLTVTETDVADLHWSGAAPVLFDGTRLPFRDGAFDAAIMLFVLQYAQNPAALLRQVRRVAPDRLIVIQSTYAGACGLPVLRCREWLQGRGALRLTALLGAPRVSDASLQVRQMWTREALRAAFEATGWSVVAFELEHAPMTSVSRDLFVLGKNHG